MAQGWLGGDCLVLSVKVRPIGEAWTSLQNEEKELIESSHLKLPCADILERVAPATPPAGLMEPSALSFRSGGVHSRACVGTAPGLLGAVRLL